MIDKADIKGRLSLPAVVELCTGKRIPRSGKIICPFHPDKSPSLKIYRDGHWHCYGCNRHGDVIQWVSEWENVGFQEALQICDQLLQS